MKKERSSNIELLRILSIFLIIFGHIMWETKWNFAEMGILRQLMIQSPWIGAKLGVNIFFIITGFFLCRRNHFQLKSLLKLWISVISYSWIILFVTIIFRFSGLSIKNEIRSIFPIGMNCYWFITVYFFIFLIHIYLNKFIEVLSKNQFEIILLIGFIYLFVLSCFFLNETAGSGNTWITGIYLYLIGAYISKFEVNNKLKRKTRELLIIFIVSLGIMIFLIYAVDELQIHGIIVYSVKKYGYFVGGNNPFGLIASIILFLLFLNMPIKNNKLINKLAGTTLAVYMLHTNYLVIDMLYNKILRLYRLQDSMFIVIYCLITSIILMSIFMLVDIVKHKLFGNFEDKIINYVNNFIDMHKFG